MGTDTPAEIEEVAGCAADDCPPFVVLGKDSDIHDRPVILGQFRDEQEAVEAELDLAARYEGIGLDVGLYVRWNFTGNEEGRGFDFSPKPCRRKKGKEVGGR